MTYRERVFPNRAASHPDNVGRVEWLEHGGGLACVDQKQKLIVPDIDLVDEDEGSDADQPCQELMSAAKWFISSRPCILVHKSTDLACITL